MSKGYKHLSVEERIKIYGYLASGESISKIAELLNHHRSSIYRELERNSTKYGYRADCAAQMYLTRRFRCKRNKISTNKDLEKFVLSKLHDGWSPEIISGYLKQTNGNNVVSHQTIYRYIYSEEGKSKKLYKLLCHKHKFRYPRIKRRRHHAKQQAKPKLHERSNEINNRSVFGHYEGDLVMFKHTKTNLITLRERKSRCLFAIKNSCRVADITAKNIIKYMKNAYIKSLTLDNGTEFASYQHIADELMLHVYFCDPYKSYQKGSIENGNRLIRTVLSRAAKIDNYSQDNIDSIIDRFNNRPMKCLKYRTPLDVFNENMRSECII